MSQLQPFAYVVVECSDRDVGVSGGRTAANRSPGGLVLHGYVAAD